MGLNLPLGVWRILRRDVDRLGFPGRSIYDQADAVRLVGYVIVISTSTQRFPPRSVHGTISMAKNENAGPIQFAEEADQAQRKIGDVTSSIRNGSSPPGRWISMIC